MTHNCKGFSLFELMIALLVASVLGAAAYKVVISSTRHMATAEKQHDYLRNLAQIESLVKEDLLNALPVRSAIAPPPTDITPLPAPNKIIRSGFTPLVGQDVDGNPAPSKTVTGIDPSEINAIRIVVLDGTDKTRRIMTALTTLTDPIIFENDPLVDVSGSPVSIFEKSRFIWIGDADKSDVFYVTGTVGTSVPNESLRHDSAGGEAPLWNDPDGLSYPYSPGGVVKSVQVVTIGIRFRSDADSAYQPYLVRKLEGMADGDALLAKGITSLRVRYFSADFPPDEKFPAEGCEAFPNLPKPPSAPYCYQGQIPFIERASIRLETRVKDSTKGGAGPGVTTNFVTRTTEISINPRNSFSRKAYTSW